MRLIPDDSAAASRRALSMDNALIPLINIVFLMLIFFMLAGSITAPDALPVEPPLSRQGKSVEDDPIALLLGRDGRIALNGQVVSPDALDARLTELLAARQTAGAASTATSGPALQVKADAAVDVGALRELMSRLRALGVARVQLTAQQRLH
ncbi:MAG: biopolymer transporter ExbD [Thiohalocapsa sp.]|nr:biopolymer transporter ExbD [Thiohalocapsa sp.]